MTRSDKEKYTQWATGAVIAVLVAVFAPAQYNPIDWIKQQIGGFQA